MCGIAGVVARGRDERRAELVSALTATLSHRGPDDQGWLLLRDGCVLRGQMPPGMEDAAAAEVALVHRRLSILDLSACGRQPMSTPDGRYEIVYNGEIYNYLELRQELEQTGHVFTSRSDTEVLLAAYAEWGRAALSRLVGMFAFAILDTHARTLFLARDFFGIKPLYYTVAGGSFAFASEIKSLLEFPGVSRTADPERLYRYLRYGQTDHGDGTMFSGIQQLPAAHCVTIALDRPSHVEPQRYWSLDSGGHPGLSFAEAASHLRELFLRSVEMHLRSDVAVGAALSGGIDSSAIVMAMRHVGGASLDLHSFSFVADDPRLSEEHWVDMVGDAAGARMHKIRVTPREIAAELQALVRLQDEPFMSTSIYAQHLVFRTARQQGVTVMLDGQGADELLAGYPAFAGARVASLLRRGRLVEAARLARALPGGWRQALSAGQFVIPPSLQAPFRALVGQSLAPAWLNTGWFEARGVGGQQLRASVGSRDVLHHDLRESVTATILPALLRFEDRNSMASSVESRVPFLTPELAQFVLSLPEAYLLSSDGTSKAVFREAMRGIVPQPVLDRRDKIGFVTPERRWLQELSPWVDELLLSLRHDPIPVLDTPMVLREWQRLQQNPEHRAPHLWRWLNLIGWARHNRVEFA